MTVHNYHSHGNNYHLDLKFFFALVTRTTVAACGQVISKLRDNNRVNFLLNRGHELQYIYIYTTVCHNFFVAEDSS